MEPIWASQWHTWQLFACARECEKDWSHTHTHSHTHWGVCLQVCVGFQKPHTVHTRELKIAARHLVQSRLPLWLCFHPFPPFSSLRLEGQTFFPRLFLHCPFHSSVSLFFVILPRGLPFSFQFSKESFQDLDESSEKLPGILTKEIPKNLWQGWANLFSLPHHGRPVKRIWPQFDSAIRQRC